MLKAITVGKYVSIQGMFVRNSDNGKIVVRVGERTFEGKPAATS